MTKEVKNIKLFLATHIKMYTLFICSVFEIKVSVKLDCHSLWNNFSSNSMLKLERKSAHFINLTCFKRICEVLPIMN